MTPYQENGQQWVVEMSTVVNRSLRRLQRRAEIEGRGEQTLVAFLKIIEMLETDPTAAGEPYYPLDAMALDVRRVGLCPLIVDFAVHRTKPIVFIKSVHLMPPGPQ